MNPYIRTLIFLLDEAAKNGGREAEKKAASLKQEIEEAAKAIDDPPKAGPLGNVTERNTLNGETDYQGGVGQEPG